MKIETEVPTPEEVYKEIDWKKFIDFTKYKILRFSYKWKTGEPILMFQNNENHISELKVKKALYDSTLPDALSYRIVLEELKVREWKLVEVFDPEEAKNLDKSYNVLNIKTNTLGFVSDKNFVKNHTDEIFIKIVKL